MTQFSILFSHSLVVYQFNILFNGDFEGPRDYHCRNGMKKSGHTMRPDTPSLSIIGTPLKVFFFLFFNFEGDQRCKNCQGPRVLSFDCLMPVSQSVMKKKRERIRRIKKRRMASSPKRRIAKERETHTQHNTTVCVRLSCVCVFGSLFFFFSLLAGRVAPLSK